MDGMTDEQFDAMMEEGLRLAKSGENVLAEEVFSELETMLSGGLNL